MGTGPYAGRQIRASVIGKLQVWGYSPALGQGRTLEVGCEEVVAKLGLALPIKAPSPVSIPKPALILLFCRQPGSGLLLMGFASVAQTRKWWPWPKSSSKTGNGYWVRLEPCFFIFCSSLAVGKGIAWLIASIQCVLQGRCVKTGELYCTCADVYYSVCARVFVYILNVSVSTLV